MPLKNICAIILGGGQGRRVAAITNNKPKNLLELKNGYTILDHQIEKLKNKCDLIIIAAGPFRDVYFDYLMEKRQQGDPEFLFVPDNREGTGTAVSNIMHRIKKYEEVIIMNGDIVTSFDPILLSTNSILVTKGRIPYGLVHCDGSRVVKFEEKPFIDGWINAGIYRLSIKSLENICPVHGSIEQSVLPDLTLTAVRFVGNWISVDSPKDFDLAKEMIE